MNEIINNYIDQLLNLSEDINISNSDKVLYLQKAIKYFKSLFYEEHIQRVYYEEAYYSLLNKIFPT